MHNIRAAHHALGTVFAAVAHGPIDGARKVIGHEPMFTPGQVTIHALRLEIRELGRNGSRETVLVEAQRQRILYRQRAQLGRDGAGDGISAQVETQRTSTPQQPQLTRKGASQIVRLEVDAGGNAIYTIDWQAAASPTLAIARVTNHPAVIVHPVWPVGGFVQETQRPRGERKWRRR